ncbi:MAG: hypothetical protein WC734_06290 [Patescibacteria group bacterium]|jgi:hypothetical protein
MNCEYCGTSIENNSNSCKKCGAPIYIKLKPSQFVSGISRDELNLSGLDYYSKYRILKTPRGYMAQKPYLFGWKNAFQRLSEEPVYFDSAEEAEQKLIECGAFEDQVTKVVKEF